MSQLNFNHNPRTFDTPKEFYEWTTSNSCTILPKWEELNPAQQAEAIVLYNNWKRKYNVSSKR